MSQPCGCQVINGKHSCERNSCTAYGHFMNTQTDYEIAYCPKHQAVDRLLAVAKLHKAVVGLNHCKLCEIIVEIEKTAEGKE